MLNKLDRLLDMSYRDIEVDDLQQAIDDSQPSTYNLRTNCYNLEDVLHRLFTQLYNDDWLFNLHINYNASNVEVSFDTFFSKAKVRKVLNNYIVE